MIAKEMKTILPAQDIFGFRTASLSVKWTEKWRAEWNRMQLDYAQYMNGADALYWYGERANLTSLAGAAWRTGFHVIEEFSAMRRRLPASEKHSGCVDLYVAHGTVGSIIEAKMCSLTPQTTDAQISRAMDEALEDVRKSSFGEQGIGAVIYVLRARQDDINDAMLLESLERIRTTRPSAVAWCFPALTRHLRSDRLGQKKLVWPGVVLSLKVAPRAE
jgi:hypothetical protein